VEKVAEKVDITLLAMWDRETAEACEFFADAGIES